MSDALAYNWIDSADHAQQAADRKVLNTDPADREDLENAVHSEVRRCLQRAARERGLAIPFPEIRFDLPGTAAGQARLGEGVIRFNPQLLERHGAEFIRSTVPHEVAHLLVHRHWGRHARPHGEEWRQVMQVLGADPSRCHNYRARPSRRLRRHIWRCRCRYHRVTSIRHNRAMRGTPYHCVSCRGRLRYVKSPEPAGGRL